MILDVLSLVVILCMIITFFIRFVNKEFKNSVISHIILIVGALLVSILAFLNRDIFGVILWISISLLWTATLILDMNDNAKIRGFEFVSELNQKFTNEALRKLPTRADYGSAGYDFYSPSTFVCKPHEITKIWTDVKAYMNEDEVLLLDVRSSMGGKFHLANTIGIIDSSYYNNVSNEGNIGFFLVNDTDETITIQKGERIGQGMFTSYLIVDNDAPESNKRIGGIGSTGK